METRWAEVRTALLIACGFKAADGNVSNGIRIRYSPAQMQLSSSRKPDTGPSPSR